MIHNRYETNKNKKGIVIIKTVSRENKEDYLLKHIYTDEYIIADYEKWSQNEECKYEISPLYNICNKMESNIKLEECANIFDGIILDIEKNKDIHKD